MRYVLALALALLVFPFAFAAHEVSRSLWQTLQAFGIFSESVSDGVTKWNVWLLTFTSAIVCSIFGMWQAAHWLPGLSAL